MDLDALRRRIALGEDSRVEFKSVARSEFKIDVRDLSKEVCSFANSGGGQILVGVDDDGTISGTGEPKQSDALLLQMSQGVFDNISPPLTCQYERVGIDGARLIVVEVPGFGPGRPYAVAGRYYIRDGARTRDASREALVTLLSSSDVHFDETPVREATFSDLSEDKMRAFPGWVFDRGADKTAVLLHLRALGCATDTGSPNVAGTLMFGADPQRFLRDSDIVAVRFRGTEVGEAQADRAELNGTLQEQAAGAEAFLRRHLSAESHVEGWDRVEQKAPSRLPQEVLREAVLNAIVHRDYRAASNTKIFVFDDRVEIVNAGGLLNKLTLDQLRVGGISQARNPILASLLKRALKRENLGVGVPFMFSEMKRLGLPEPAIEATAGHFKVTLRGV